MAKRICSPSAQFLSLSPGKYEPAVMNTIEPSPTTLVPPAAPIAMHASEYTRRLSRPSCREISRGDEEQLSETSDLAIFAPPFASDQWDQWKVTLSEHVRSESRVLMCLHLVAAISLVLRAVYISVLAKCVGSELWKGFGTACAYLIIGVALPMWSSYIGRSSPVSRILIVAAAYAEHKTAPFRVFLFVAKVMFPCAIALGVVAPIVAWVQVFYDKLDENGSFSPSPLTIATMVAVFLWFVVSLFFGPVTSAEAVLDASIVSVVGLISDIEAEVDAPHWSTLARKHNTLEHILADAWSWHCAGGLWLSRVILLLASSLIMGALGFQHDLQAICVPYRCLGVLFAILGVALLLRLAYATSLCQSSNAEHMSITSASLGWVSYIEDPMRNSEYQAFLAYIRSSDMAIKVLGISITYALVFKLAMRMIVYIPLALAVLSEVLKAQVPMAVFRVHANQSASV